MEVISMVNGLFDGPKKKIAAEDDDDWDDEDDTDEDDDWDDEDDYDDYEFDD